jgi:hypothetical protein
MLKDNIFFKDSVYRPLHYLSKSSFFTGSLELNKRLIKPTLKHFVISNVNIIPMNVNTILRNKTILIKDGFIEKILNGNESTIPPNTTVINGKGKYIVPGLIDMHVHIENPEYLLLFIANGITTVRNMGGLPFILKYKDNIKQRKMLGPKIFTAGPILDGPDPVWKWSIIIQETEKVNSLIVKNVKTKYDFIKIYNNLSNSVYKEIMKTSRLLGIKVIGHVPKEVKIEEVVTEQQYSVEHIQHLTNEHDLRVAGGAGVWCFQP